MGYNTTPTQTLIAKLTPLGRQLLVTSNTLITSFSLGDSDANYNALLPLTTGQIPAEWGNY
jgi:high-affinity K+ transport system ATPase subunit B